MRPDTEVAGSFMHKVMHKVHLAKRSFPQIVFIPLPWRSKLGEFAEVILISLLATSRIRTPHSNLNLIYSSLVCELLIFSFCMVGLVWCLFRTNILQGTFPEMFWYVHIVPVGFLVPWYEVGQPTPCPSCWLVWRDCPCQCHACRIAEST